MFPAWLTKPESMFWIFLWLTSPLWAYVVEKVSKKIRSQYAASSEAMARDSLEKLDDSLRNPPSLNDDIAVIICFLPLPLALALAMTTAFLFPRVPPAWVMQADPHAVKVIALTILLVPLLSLYCLYALLTLHGFKIAWRLRHGARFYTDTYKKGIQKQIDKLRKKYPNIQLDDHF
jgi:hypothetical protein